MKKVLLANLGNRNLYYRNDKGDYLTIVNYIKDAKLEEYIILNEAFLTEEYDFRQFTKVIWENIKNDSFDRNLIDARTLTITDLRERDYEHVYLFYTDQEGTKFAYQDTLYEALVLQRLFNEAIPELPVTLLLVPGNPSDEKNLYQQYKPIVKQILDQHPDSQLVFHDVGGTTQMKVVIKTLLEYYLRQQTRPLSIRYKDHWSENARESDRTLHSRYVLLDVAREFITHFQFSAAVSVLRRIADDTEPALQRITYHSKLADDRLNFRYRPSPAEYAKNAGEPIASFSEWSKKQIPNNFLPDLILTERVKIFEFATICDFYFNQENYTLGVATFYRLCEELSQAFVKTEGKYSLDNKDSRDNFANSVYSKVQTLLTGTKGPQYGVPILLAYAYKSTPSDRLKKVYETLLPTISHVNGTTNSGMNYLRNKCWLAHDNYAITEDAINNEVPDFINGKNILGRLYKLMGLSTENAIMRMQKDLLSELRAY